MRCPDDIDHVDLAMIGCGMPDLYAELLASNLSMIARVAGARVPRAAHLPKGGGHAYLGRSMIIGGRQFPGGGILPFDALLLPDPEPPMPVT